MPKVSAAAVPVPAWCILGQSSMDCCHAEGRNCAECGWNPDVHRERMARIHNRDFRHSKSGQWCLAVELSSPDTGTPPKKETKTAGKPAARTAGKTAKAAKKKTAPRKAAATGKGK